MPCSTSLGGLQVCVKHPVVVALDAQQLLTTVCRWIHSCLGRVGVADSVVMVE